MANDRKNQETPGNHGTDEHTMQQGAEENR